MGEQEEVRGRIIREATRLFAERGYAATSVREIAEAVGVTKPTLYYHFGSKDGLFTALVNHHLGCWLDVIAGCLQAPAPVLDRIRAYVAACFQLHLDDPMVLRFLHQAIQQAGQGAPLVDAKKFHEGEVVLLIALLQEDHPGHPSPHDPVAGALMLLGDIRIRLGATLHGGPPLTADTADQVLDLLLHGVAP
ncbi:MAG: TetR/AcrR family transcriptional regulator [Deltaproteobacteria bacterium]|nr:TetR/AcrR family transcriptional regulator [Deltaproteobacteria bacterium]